MRRFEDGSPFSISKNAWRIYRVNVAPGIRFGAFMFTSEKGPIMARKSRKTQVKVSDKLLVAAHSAWLVVESALGRVTTAYVSFALAVDAWIDDAPEGAEKRTVSAFAARHEEAYGVPAGTVRSTVSKARGIVKGYVEPFSLEVEVTENEDGSVTRSVPALAGIPFDKLYGWRGEDEDTRRALMADHRGFTTRPPREEPTPSEDAAPEGAATAEDADTASEDAVPDAKRPEVDATSNDSDEDGFTGSTDAETVRIAVEPDIARRLRALAKERDVSVSDVIRGLLDAGAPKGAATRDNVQPRGTIHHA